MEKNRKMLEEASFGKLLLNLCLPTILTVSYTHLDVYKRQAVTYVGNEELLFQIWQNLFGNAVKFSNPGGSVLSLIHI